MSESLPPNWAWTSLGNLGIEVRGQVVPRAGTTYDLYSVPAFPSLRPERIDGSDIKSGKRQVRADDVLLCKINPRINRVWSVGEADGRPQVASTEYLVLRPYERGMGQFIWRFLSSPPFRKWIELSVEGATGSHTRAKSGPILNQPVPVAPSAEQKRIVAAIEDYFTRLDATDRALADVKGKLASLQRSAVRQLFDKADWPWTTLGAIATLKGGITKDSKRQNDPSFVEVPYLRVANVQRGYLNLSEVTTIRVSPTRAAQLALRPGDILFNEGGDRDKLGRGWVWEGQIENCIHQNHVFRARLSSGDFDPYFISVHGNTWGQRWFETHGKQTTNLASLNLTTLKSFPVPAPPLVEQREIAAELQSIRRNGERLQTEITRAESRSSALRRSILASAFSGRLVPQDLDDEPASALLERIAASRPATPTRRRHRP